MCCVLITELLRLTRLLRDILLSLVILTVQACVDLNVKVANFQLPGPIIDPHCPLCQKEDRDVCSHVFSFSSCIPL